MNIRLMVKAAMLAAITAIATMVIQIPAPLAGYVNCGDAFVLLSGFALGPVYGGLAAGIGSAIADIITYPVYAPATFIIKFAMAAVCGIIYKKKATAMSALVSSVIAELIMIIGYLVYGMIIFGETLTAAIATVPGNSVQAVVGVVLGLILLKLVGKILSK